MGLLTQCTASGVVLLSCSILSRGLEVQHQVPATPAEPRVGGISGLSHASELENGMRCMGSVHVGPPVRLMETIPPYAEGVEVVPVAYTFQFLRESEWRESSDGLCFRSAGGREMVGFSTWVRTHVDATDRTQVDVSILPRDELSWTQVQTKQDIRITVSEAREE